MRLEAFDFALPKARVAQEPAERRDASRLLVVRRSGGPRDDTTFDRIGTFLRPGDLLVVNDTKVVPARLQARKPSGGAVDLVLVERVHDERSNGQPRRSREAGDQVEGDWPTADGEAEIWTCLARSARGLARGTRLAIAPGFWADCAGADGAGRLRVRLRCAGGAVAAAIREHGLMPLPPYIRREPGGRGDRDRERYQTVYAREEGAIAAPTAGLHFTTALLDDLRRRGIAVAALTLHVGPGTFLPIRAADVEEHRLEPERFILPDATAEAVRSCRARGGRVVAVGTTVARVLEARASGDGCAPGAGRCDLYITPGYDFRVVDALLTNFHLPRSTLIVLVAAFAGLHPVLDAYREAIVRGFRFHSYGDAMLIL